VPRERHGECPKEPAEEPDHCADEEMPSLPPAVVDGAPKSIYALAIIIPRAAAPDLGDDYDNERLPRYW